MQALRKFFRERENMWRIEVSEDASEEEVIQAILEELDFDYIRESIAQLNDVIENYGPLTEVYEATEDADSSDLHLYD